MTITEKDNREARETRYSEKILSGWREARQDKHTKNIQ